LTSEPQYENAYRNIAIEHECSERGGKSCVGESQKSRQCNILDIKNDKISEKEKEIKALQDEIKGLKEACDKKDSGKKDDGKIKGWGQPGHKIGLPNADCLSTCERYGLKCTQNGLRTNNYLVDTSEELVAMITQLGVDLSEAHKKKKCGSMAHVQKMPEHPVFSTYRGRFVCLLSAPEDSTKQTCFSKPWQGQAYMMKQRVCYCEK